MENEKAHDTARQKNKGRWLAPTLVIGALIVVVILGWFFMRGTSTTTGQNKENETTDSLTCLATDLSYPFFTYDNSDSKEMRIAVIFGDNIVDSISFIYTLHYSSSESATASANVNENALGVSFQQDGLGAIPLNAHFSKTTDTLKLSLYAKASDINDTSKKYFLLSDLSRQYTKDAVRQVYVNQGFNCE